MKSTGFKDILRKAKKRMEIHKHHKSEAIKKKKKEIKGCLEANNEVLALHHTEVLINDERLVFCYELLTIRCDEVIERMPDIAKAKKDVPQLLHKPLQTILYASHRLQIEELKAFEKIITKLCGKEFVHQAEADQKCVDENVKQNINPIMPEAGQRVDKLLEIASAENVLFCLSEKSQQVYKKYIEKMGSRALSFNLPVRSFLPSALAPQCPAPQSAFHPSVPYFGGARPAMPSGFSLAPCPNGFEHYPMPPYDSQGMPPAPGFYQNQPSFAPTYSSKAGEGDIKGKLDEFKKM
eukprot:TRINITY_DN1768_c0_g2_i9.p1 TRINITY_DN1768_c0_g2~~TRINITY_DN1768_c0_g2_i9.p1  ORF type:complete len:294 (+),score=79.78 TRINITY_DN1768_c0_g2_i9:49-930(+)